MNRHFRITDGIKGLLRLVRIYAGQVYWSFRLRKLMPQESIVGHPPRVSYIHGEFPNPIPSAQAVVTGGAVKYQSLNRAWPHAGLKCDILYGVSSAHFRHLEILLRQARRRGIKLVWNQNGVAYPAWRPEDWEAINQPMQMALLQSDYVFYQSRFCKDSADRYLGERRKDWEILYNAVNTQKFHPLPNARQTELPVLLAIGSIQAFYRLECLLKTLKLLHRDGFKARLLVVGQCHWSMETGQSYQERDNLVVELGLGDWVTFRAEYSQVEAPGIFQHAHMLVHTQVNDACPAVVLEAMASGLPVVYSMSGGTPELVGKDAGIGVPATADWEHIQPPDPEALSEAVLKIAERRATFSEAARQRAVERFDLSPWLKRHEEVFESMLSK